MGLAMEVVSGRVTNPGAALTALTPNTGNSFTIRNAAPGSRVHLLDAWSDASTAAGTFQIRSPQLHDNVRGIRLDAPITQPHPNLPDHFRQLLFAQDPLTLEGAGPGVGQIFVGAILLFYEDLPGVNGRFISEAELMERGKNILTVENTIATTADGNYGGEEAINAESDLLKNNVDYAILGYLVDTLCALVGWRGADTGNLRVGGPGDQLGRQYTRSWFLRLARRYGMPLIPVFNASNKANLLLDAVQLEGGADVTVTTILEELAPAAGAR